MNSNVRDLFAQQSKPLAPGGEPPHDGGMDGFDNRLKTVEQDVAVIKATMATKADVQTLRGDLLSAVNAQTWKILGLLVALVGAAIAIAKFVH